MHAQVYEDVRSLRYGHLMIMTDQDHDGSHIKGLIMNYLHHFYPSLLKLPGFLLEFITPIIKVRAAHNLCRAVLEPDLCCRENARHRFLSMKEAPVASKSVLP